MLSVETTEVEIEDFLVREMYESISCLHSDTSQFLESWKDSSNLKTEAGRIQFSKEASAIIFYLKSLAEKTKKESNNGSHF